MDLKSVKDKIKKGIWRKIVEFKVDKLDDLVKSDLVTLKGKILDHADTLEDQSASRIKTELGALAAQKKVWMVLTVSQIVQFSGRLRIFKV
ncbi:excinuclease ABC subunit B, putative [Babesia ovata]|uniref:Excinuclease ABC subunit B, putative n=1 Tax=Babesia ovata TaxID=189622 RepID=A0A2H6K805_9APIC|nr:excinuclease ABC subunit B, putative [Babesia ovata]GBE59125.1 excinuclease ABC subunit B, putative [Babesia ovata]